MTATAAMTGWPRDDGRKGLRNVVLVAYLVECAQHVCTRIARPFDEAEVQVIGFSRCFPSDYGQEMMAALCTHPNVGAVQLVSLGCENFRKQELARAVRESGRPANLVTIQSTGGTAEAIETGRAWVAAQLEALRTAPRVPMAVDELVIGTICGGLDATSGLTGNPAAGRAFDRFVAEGATCIFEETGELIGCAQIMAERVADAKLRAEVVATVEKAARCSRTATPWAGSPPSRRSRWAPMRSPARARSAASSGPPSGRRAPGSTCWTWYGPPTFGFSNINETAEIVELMACGAHAVIFVTGRGSVVGSAISPVLKVCANPETYERMKADMDVNAGRILRGAATLDEVGDEIHDRIVDLGRDRRTRSEELGHVEFVLTYKTARGAEPGCHV